MGTYHLQIDIDEGKDSEGKVRSPEKIENYLRLSLQQSLTKANCIINKVEVKQKARPAGAPRGKGTAGRKPVNRPKIEAWIRANVTAGPSTQGTTGLNGVDKDGRPLIDAPNRIYVHRLMAPEPEGVGLPQPSIEKVLRELDVEGYLERGFAAGAPFYELVRPLEDEGQVGVRGREVEGVDEDALTEELEAPEARVIDFSSLADDELDID